MRRRDGESERGRRQKLKKKKGGKKENRQEVATGQTALRQAGSFPGCQDVLDPDDAPACLCRGATGIAITTATTLHIGTRLPPDK